MKRSISAFYSMPWYPLVFAIYPIIALFANNINQTETVVVFRPVVISILISCVLFILFHLWFHDWQRAAFPTAIFVLLFFLYGHAYNYFKTIDLFGLTPGRHRLLLLVWVVLAALSVFIASRKRNDIKNHAGTLNTIAAALLVFPVVTIISHGISVRATLTPYTPSEKNMAIESDESLPDVYYIILDSYTRSDVLKEVYGYDNSSFLNELSQMGFVVAECSTSNYMWTRLSISSSLNMNYLQENPVYLQASDKDVITEDLIKHSNVRKTLESFGYKTVAFATGFPFNEVTDADVFLEPPSSMASIRGFEALLVETTLLRVLQDFGYIRINQTASAQFRDRTLFALDEFDYLARMEGPKFAYIHIITPHPPFVFGRNGEVVEPKDFLSTEGQYTEDSYVEGYTNQVEFISGRIIKSIDKLLKESSTPPIIILQGDHGPWKQQGENRVSILNAYYLPGHSEVVYSSISPVNSFRLVLNEYFHGQYPILDDRSYESPYANVYDFQLRPTSCTSSK